MTKAGLAYDTSLVASILHRAGRWPGQLIHQRNCSIAATGASPPP